MNAIELKDISVIYGENTPFRKAALNNINAFFPKGSITGIIGHTGSGKSTLASLLNGLLKPTSGTVLLEGTDIWEKPKEIAKIRYRVGLVMQYPEYQLFEETVFKDIAFGPKNMKLSEAEIKERVLRAAEFTGVKPEHLGKSPFDLSGGEKRRAAIAGVMSMEPQVLIFDEPAAGLDPKGRKDLIKLIADYRKQTGSTVIVVSHSMEDIAKYADRILVMYEGEIVGDLDPKQITVEELGLYMAGAKKQSDVGKGA